MVVWRPVEVALAAEGLVSVVSLAVWAAAMPVPPAIAAPRPKATAPAPSQL